MTTMATISTDYVSNSVVAYAVVVLAVASFCVWTHLRSKIWAAIRLVTD
jgi:hypothetical protein